MAEKSCDIEFLYRFRSMNALINEFKELQKEQIYFAQKTELNDPMDGYMEVTFYGDEVLWTNFFRNYFYFFGITVLVTSYASACGMEGNPENIIIADYRNHNPMHITKHLYTQSCEILDNEFSHIKGIIKDLAEINKPIKKKELYMLLCSDGIHKSIYDYFIDNIAFKDECLYSFAKTYIAQTLKDQNKNHIGLDSDAIQANDNNSIESVFFKAALREKPNSEIRDCVAYEYKRLQEINKRFLLEFPKHYLNELEKIVIGKDYIASFSGNYSNMAMWGHYADGAKGACLIFERNKKDDGLPIFINTHNNVKAPHQEYQPYKACIKKITYSKEIPQVDFFKRICNLTSSEDIQKKYWICLDDAQESILAKGWLDDSDENTVTKLKAWEYEDEYRVILPDNMVSGNGIKRKAKFNINSLSGIIFGVDTSINDKVAIMKIIYEKYRNGKVSRDAIIIYQAKYVNNNNDVNDNGGIVKVPIASISKEGIEYIN